MASAWAGAQFLDGTAMSGNATGSSIAAGNVPNLVDLETGGLGPVIANGRHCSETTSLETLTTLVQVLSA